MDDNFDGCIDEGCTIGSGQCTCVAHCDSPSCNPAQVASCDPRKNVLEICGDGVDNNCNGMVDEGCLPKTQCGGTAGQDPIVLSSQSAVTEPFSDFSVDTGLLNLALTRTYTSNDTSYFGGSTGAFGRGWHHQWEGWLSCQGQDCTVALGLTPGLRFRYQAQAPSLDGLESWQIFAPATDPAFNGGTGQNHNVLARRPGGAWVLFLADGRELHFDVACDACSNPAGDPFCQDATLGGKARLVRVVDGRGSAIGIGYNRTGGVLFALSDDLGHSLEVRSATACGAALADELRYDSMVVARYTYSGLDLTRAEDADGAVLRSYAYDTQATQRLLAVKNQAGESAAEFAYDGYGRATGIIDRDSNVHVNYDAPGGIEVTEYYGTTSSTGLRIFDIDGFVTSLSDGCACGPARTFQWSAQRLTRVTDALGHVTQQDFDALGRLTHRVESGLREEWSEYGLVKPVAQGVSVALETPLITYRPSTVSAGVTIPAETLSFDPAPQSIDPPGYSCQETPRPVGSTLCRRTASGYTYDAAGAVYTERHATFYSYDALGRITRTYGPVNLDRPGAADVIPVEERVYWSGTESLARRGRVRLVKRYSAPGTALTTSYDYDAFGAFTITQPNGALTTIVKDGRGRARFVLTSDGVAETRYHDGLSPRLQLSPGGGAVRISYDSMARVTSKEYLSGDPDGNGNPTLAWSEAYSYDAAGNRVHAERRDGSGTVTWRQDRTFDVQHRLVSDTNPESPATGRSVSYDVSGFLTTVTDEEGRATAFTPDGLNRVAKVRRSGLTAQGLPTSLDVARYAYQAGSDSLGSVIDGAGRNNGYSHDDFGRLAKLQMPVGGTSLGTVTFMYDARGNLTTRVQQIAPGQSTTVSYTYDGLDRVLTTVASNTADGSSVAYSYLYDEAGFVGRLTTVVEPERIVTFGYDAAGRLARESVQEGGVADPLVTQYAYGSNGDVSNVVYPSGLHVRLVRDPATGEVTEAFNTADGTRYATGLTDLPGGPAKAMTLGNAVAASSAFNLRHEPRTISSGPLSLGYGMSPSGDVISIGDYSRTLNGCQRNTSPTIQYDFLDRLVGSSGWLEYTYDSNGNRTYETFEGTRFRLYYSGGDDRPRRSMRLTDSQWYNRHGFGYDHQGNVSALGRYDIGGVNVVAATCLRHDPLGRIVLVGDVASQYLLPQYFGTGTYWWTNPVCTQDSHVQNPTAQFKYDSKGRRIARWLASTGQWTYILSDPDGHPISELVLVSTPAPHWVPLRDYVWLNDRPLAQIEYPGPGGSAQGYAYYFHVDHIGLPRAMTNSAGQLVWNTYARPFGDVDEKTMVDPLSGRTVVTNLRLPGQYDERLLGSVGLQGPYYNWNRWYLPGVGRYLELDPIAISGEMNTAYGPDWFNYALGNPLGYYDADGRNAGVLAGLACGPPCAVAGFVAVAAATAVAAKMTADIVRECKKDKPCSCTCYRRGGDKLTSTSTSIGQQPSPAECARTCVGLGYSGSKCGSKDVTWQN